LTTDGFHLTISMSDIRCHILNALNLTYVGSVAVNLVGDGLAIIAGCTLVWFNVERALTARKKRKE
jgi:hypothetical protein